MPPSPSTRLAYIVLAVQIDERVSNNVAHDLALRSVDRCVEDIQREFHCELESMVVSDDLNFGRVSCEAGLLDAPAILPLSGKAALNNQSMSGDMESHSAPANFPVLGAKTSTEKEKANPIPESEQGEHIARLGPDLQVRSDSVTVTPTGRHDIPGVTPGAPAELSPNESQKDSPSTSRRTNEGGDSEQHPERVSVPRHFMFCECSYCELNYNYKPCGPEDHLKKTHGICPACAEIEKSKIERLRLSLFSLNTQQILEQATVNH